MIMPEGDSENSDGTSSQNIQGSSSQNIQCLMGVYFDEFNLTFKLTQQISASKKFFPPLLVNKDDFTSKNYVFNPFISCNFKGNL